MGDETVPSDFSKLNIPETKEEGLEAFMAKDAAVQKKMIEKLRKNPIDPKKYKGKVQKIDFTEEEAKK